MMQDDRAEFEQLVADLQKRLDVGLYDGPKRKDS
jgi:hypothetical protein